MKHRDLVKQINQIAKTEGLTPIWREGANHEVVTIADRSTAVPRHREIEEHLARAILRDLTKN